MNRFVNYNKRTITLPKGCKDLVELLQPTKRTPGDPKTHPLPRLPAVKTEAFVTCGLAHIERYVSMIVNSGSAQFHLQMQTPAGDCLALSLTNWKANRTLQVILASRSSACADAIRAFFRQRGLQPIQDWPLAGLGEEKQVHLYPLPLDVAGATAITKELLKKIHGLNDESGLSFWHYEVASDPVKPGPI